MFWLCHIQQVVIECLLQAEICDKMGFGEVDDILLFWLGDFSVILTHKSYLSLYSLSYVFSVYLEVYG